MFWQYLMLGLSSVAILLAGFTPSEGTSVESELSIEVVDEMLNISGTVTNRSEEEKKLTYHLEVKRSGRSGTTSTSQSGSLDLKAGEDSGISTTSINAANGDTCEVSLKVRDSDDKLVSASNVKLTIKE